MDETVAFLISKHDRKFLTPLPFAIIHKDCLIVFSQMGRISGEVRKRFYEMD